MGDPKRLLASARPGGVEAALLGSGGEDGPREEEKEAVWNSLVRVVPAALAAGAGAPLGRAVGIAGRGALAHGAVVVALAGGIGLGALGLYEWRERVGTRAVVAAAADAPAAPSSLDSLPSPLPLPVAVPSSSTAGPPSTPVKSGAALTRTAAAVQRRVETKGVAAANRPEDRAAPDDAALRADTALVLAARQDVRAGRCQEALERLDAAGAASAASPLLEEREKLAAVALRCLGRVEEAAARERAFERRFPGSVYGERGGL